jgi:hypothetical protein
MEKLTSMTDFVLKESCNKNRNSIDNLNTIFRYALFLKQPLELWMFVPCDEKGDALVKSSMSENTCEDDCNHRNCVLEMNECIKYQQAKERCLFEKSDYCEILLFELYDFVEDLTYAKVNLQLTPTAIKQIGL